MLKEEKKPSIISKTLEKIKNLGKPSAKPTIINHDAKQIAIKLIKECEGCKLNAYKCSAGVWTIGYGHIEGAKEGMKITQEQAEAYFESDIMDYLLPVQKEVGQICNANQIAALTSFAFNVGNAELKKSTLLKVIKKTPNNFPAIRKEFMRWVYADGKVIDGLKKRRVKEADLYEKA
jgi:GH24 family phage-related lysozyme (muramidase)